MLTFTGSGIAAGSFGILYIYNACLFLFCNTCVPFAILQYSCICNTCVSFATLQYSWICNSAVQD